MRTIARFVALCVVVGVCAAQAGAGGANEPFARSRLGLIALDKTNELTALPGSEGVALVRASWVKHKAYLTGWCTLTGPDWTEVTFRFKAAKDGKVSLQLHGADLYVKGRRVSEGGFVYVDTVSAKGSEVKNGDFEELDNWGGPLHWAYGAKAKQLGGGVIQDKEIVHTGENCLKVSRKTRTTQVIPVKKGEEVQLTIWFRYNFEEKGDKKDKRADLDTKK